MTSASASYVMFSYRSFETEIERAIKFQHNTQNKCNDIASITGRTLSKHSQINLYDSILNGSFPSCDFISPFSFLEAIFLLYPDINFERFLFVSAGISIAGFCSSCKYLKALKKPCTVLTVFKFSTPSAASSLMASSTSLRLLSVPVVLLFFSLPSCNVQGNQ